MKATCFKNNGTEVSFERDTLEECEKEYRKRRKYGANWGHVYIDGKRVWL